MAGTLRDVDVNSKTAIGSAVILGTIGVLSFIVQPGLVQGFSAQYEVGEDVANFLASAEGFGIALATILAAFASRIINWRLIVGLSLLIAAGGNIVSALINEPNDAFRAARFVTGLGEGGIISMSFSMIGLTQRIERNLSIYLILLLTYGAFGLWIMPTILGSAGLSAVFYAWAGVTILSFATIKFLPRGSDNRAEPSPTAANVAIPMVIVGLLAVLAYNIAIGIAWANLFFVGLEVRNNEQAIANALLLCQFVAIAGAIIPVFMETKLGRWFPVISGILIAAASIAMLLDQPSYAMFIFAICLFNFIWNFFQPFLLSSVEDMRKGEMMTIAIAVQMMGLVGLGPFVAGYILSNGGTLQTALYTVIALLLASLVLLSAAKLARRKALAAGL